MIKDSGHKGNMPGFPSREGLLRSVEDFIIQTPLYLAIAGFCGAALAGVASGLPFDLATCLIPAFIIFAGYTFDRLSGISGESDLINQPERSLYFHRHRGIILCMAGGGLGATVFLCLSKSLLLGLSLVILPVITAGLYSFGWKRFLPQVKYGRAKDIPLAKTILTSALWGMVMVGIPVLYRGLPLSVNVLLIYIYLSWRLAFNTVIFDMVDIEGDHHGGTRTLPVMWGIRKTMIVLLIANGLSLGWIAVPGNVPVALRIALYTAVFYAFVYLFLLTRAHDRRRFINWVVDGELLFTCLVFLLVHLFV